MARKVVIDDKHVLSRKLLDVLLAARAEYLLVMDTDVLWFSESNQILDCVKTRALTRANAEVACWGHIACHAANIALYLDRKVRYDTSKHEFIGDEQANRLRSEALREPWRI